MQGQWNGRHGEITGRGRMNEDRLQIDGYKQTHCYEFENHLQLRHFLNDDSLNSLKVIHFNIRSFYKNIESILILIQSIDIQFDIIALSEAWLDQDKIVTTIDGYDTFQTTDNWNRSDGVVVYLKSNLNGTCTEVKLGDATGLQINFNVHRRQYSILATYRSPTMNCNTFLEELKLYYKKMSTKSTYIFTGDTNIDILTDLSNDIKDEYLNFLSEIGFLKCIDKPTRVTEHSMSCLDHIFVKHVDDRAVTSGVLKTCITDHYAVLTKIGFTDDYGSNLIDDRKTTGLILTSKYLVS